MNLQLKMLCRLTPAYALILGFHTTWLRHLGDGPNWNYYIGREFSNCRKNWWANIFYISNYLDLEHMVSLLQSLGIFQLIQFFQCLPTTWYLALDTQYFGIILLVIMIIKKYPKCIWFLLTGLLILAMALTFHENYVYDFPMLLLPYPE